MKIKPCSEIWLHNFPNLKWNTKCKDCGKTVDEITGIEKEVLRAKINKLENELKENQQISDSISKFIQERDEARKEVQRMHKVLGYQTWMLKHRLDKIHKLKDDRKTLNDKVIKFRKEISHIQDWGYGGIVFYNNEFPRFTEVVELKDLKKWAKETNKETRK